MIEKIVTNLVSKMIREKLIDGKKNEQYIYSFTSMLERLITIGTILCISIILKQFIQTILFLTFFMSLRKRTGGFHADTFMKCYILTISLYIAVILINTAFTDYQKLFLWILFPALCIILFFGTINHPNLHMDARELKEAKKAARIIAVLEGILIYFMAFLGIDLNYIGYMASAVIVSAIMLCIAKIIKQEVEVDEENSKSNFEGR